MKRKKESIIFDNTVYLAEENDKGFPFYMRLLQLIAVLCGSYCFITVFIRCLELDVISSRLYWAIGLAGVIFFIFFVFPSYDLIKIMIFAAAYGWMFYRFFKHIENGFYHLENAVIKRASEYYGFDAFRFVADYTNRETDLTLVAIFILIPVTGLLAFSLLRGKLNRLTYTIMVIPYAASFAMGITPPEFQLIVYIVLFLFSYVSGDLLHAADYSHNKSERFQKGMIRRIGIKSVFVLCLMSLLIFWSLKLTVPAEKYENYNQEKIKKAKIEIQNKMTDLSFRDISEKISDVKWRAGSGRQLTSSGGLNCGELGRVDRVVYDNTVHLMIKAPLNSVSEGIYLRGYVGSVYTGDSWETHTDDIIERYEEIMGSIDGENFEPAVGGSIILNGYGYTFPSRKGNIVITNIKADKRFVYAPYISLFNEDDRVRFEYDLAVLADGSAETGNYNYFYNVFETMENFGNGFSDFLIKESKTNEQLAEYVKNEMLYRRFVYETYTRLPEKGLERLKNDFSPNKAVSYRLDLADTVKLIKRYLYENTRYTLEPGRLPKDKDFVEYFLYENKLGYCTHYASAGVLMLRAMGYPARYVEGYVVNRNDINNSSVNLADTGDGDSMVEIAVKDSDAHAWAEVYLDGFGWIPAEFTVGAGVNDVFDNLDDTAGFGGGFSETIPTLAPTLAPIQAPAKKPEKPETNTEDNPVNETELTGQLPAEKDRNGENNGKTGKPDETTKSLKTYGAIIPILILIVAVLTYIYRKAKEKHAGEDFSKSALYVYEKIERLFIAGRLLPKKERCLEDNEEYVMQHLTLVPVNDFENCMNIVKKARFAKEPISYNEYLTVEKFYNKLYKRVYEDMSGTGRLRLKLMDLCL